VADPGRALGLSSDERARLIVQAAAVLAALGAGLTPRPDEPQPEPTDKLLTAEQAAQRTGLTIQQLRSRKLPFKRKLGHRTIRYSERGLERWLRRSAS
jgi:predicted DNA-binding transcriptional regulator AlpA